MLPLPLEEGWDEGELPEQGTLTLPSLRNWGESGKRNISPSLRKKIVMSQKLYPVSDEWKSSARIDNANLVADIRAQADQMLGDVGRAKNDHLRRWYERLEKILVLCVALQ